MRRALAIVPAVVCAALAAAPPAPATAEDEVAVGAFIPGAAQDPGRVDAYTRKTGRRPALLMFYRTWGEGEAFDAATLEGIFERRMVPLVTWEPSGHRLADIAAGDHDDYLFESAEGARRFGHTILVRFAHEMNGDWYDWNVQENPPEDYVRAWRHVVRLFRRAGARNVRWVWTPNVDYGGSRLYRSVYPGDRFVDWVGLSGFSWGGPWEWQSVTSIFERSYRAIVGMTSKPFVIAETAAGEVGGDKREWIESAFGRELPKLDRVRAFVWFNGKDKWANWSVDSSRRALAAYREAVASPRYGAGPKDVVALTRRAWCCSGSRAAMGRMR